VGPSSESNRNGWRGAERKGRQCGVTGEEWDEWVDESDGEGENVCDIPGDECGDQGGVQGDKICDEKSCDRCGDEVSAIGVEDMHDEREDEFGKRVAVKVPLSGTEVAANVDTACWSIWLDWKTILAGGGTDFEEGGEANAADGHSLDVAGRGKIDIMLWGRLLPGYLVRLMRTLPSRMLLGR
jgi:hypothetical protein